MMGSVGGWGVLGWSGALLMALVGVTLLLLIVRGAFPASRQGDSDAALERLRRRYADGAIDEATYEQARQALAHATIEEGA